MIVANGAIERTFYVERAVTLGLVAALVLAIENVEVMPPDVFIVGIKADAVFRMHHDGKITQLNITTVTTEHTKAMQGGIIAYTLDGQVHILALSLYL